MSVTAARGFVAGAVKAGIQKQDLDLTVIRTTSPAVGTAMFTRNRVQAAPVVVSRAHLEQAYAGSPVVRVLPHGVNPEIARVQGTDTAEIGIFTDGSTGTTIVICALDNLGKGAAGQAIQNANLVLGLDETLGLRLAGVFV